MGVGVDADPAIGQLDGAGALDLRLNRNLLGNGDSRDPELAGIRGAVMGSLFTLLVTLCLSFPIGVAAAVYLEEFAPKNRFTDIIAVNITTLVSGHRARIAGSASRPSIVGIDVSSSSSAGSWR